MADKNLTGALENEGVILVAGATGGVGKRVVKRLLQRQAKVRALVRDAQRGRAILGDAVDSIEVDLTIPETFTSAVTEGVTAVICCTGTKVQPVEGDTPSREKYYQGIKFYMPEVVDVPEKVEYEGMQNLVNAVKDRLQDSSSPYPRFILISSAGVTRPGKPGLNLEEEPPAVRMNDRLGGILTWKLRGEEVVRASGIPYTIIRPCALTEEPGGKALVFDRGDTLKGQVPREDIAELCIRALGAPNARNVTFEVAASQQEGRGSTDFSLLFSSLAAD